MVGLKNAQNAPVILMVTQGSFNLSLLTVQVCVLGIGQRHKRQLHRALINLFL